MKTATKLERRPAYLKRPSLIGKWANFNSIDDVISDPEYAYDFIDFFSRHDLEPNRGYYVEVSERYDDYLVLLEDFGLARVDWQPLQVNQERAGHRQVGFRYQTDVILDIFSRIEKVHGSLEKSLSQKKRAEEIAAEILQSSHREKPTDKAAGYFELHVTQTGKVWVRTTANSKYLLAKPEMNGTNDTFMTYLYEKYPHGTEETITVEDINRDRATIKLNKSFHKIANELGFTGVIKQVFFPRMGARETTFRTQMKVEDLTAEDIDVKTLIKQLEQRHKKLAAQK